MQYIFSILMGIVQGLTEFLPVSSSGHLLVAERILAQLGYRAIGVESLLIMLHLGSLFAVAIYFFKDWMNILLHPIKNKTLSLILLASVPAVIAKLVLGDTLDSLLGGRFLGLGFLVTALFLVLADRASAGDSARSGEITPARAGIMGLFQAFAILPGVSRSGSTIFGGILSGNSRQIAAKFSFLMSAPVIFGGFAFAVKDAVKLGTTSQMFAPDVLLAVLFAFLSGYFAIGYMMKKIEKVKLSKFSAYLAVLGLFVIFCQLTGFLGFKSML